VDLPGVSYNLTTDEKRAMCQWLRGVKVPTGFSSNIKSLVSIKDLTLTSSNAHTTLLQLLLQLLLPYYYGIPYYYYHPTTPTTTLLLLLHLY
jgi:hypothetical protein